MTNQQILEKYQALMVPAREAQERKNGEIAALCQEAGIEFCNLHNAMIGYRTGKPWTGVDYTKLLQVEEIAKHEFDEVITVQDGYREELRRWASLGENI